MINNCVFMGRLCDDPELKTTQTGTSVTSFSLAVERSYAKQGEQRQTDFIPITAWRQTAEFICKYFHKGDMIALTGELQSRRYQDKDGSNRTAYEVVARDVSFCGSKSESGGQAQSRPQYQPQGQQYPQQAQYNAPPPYAGNNDGYNYAQQHIQGQQERPIGYGHNPPPVNPNIEYDDDLPF
ncbi:MAG: single-stranded DNA-binding protein [Clostridia bacterium]|nr:single-stranded DNA-binding protein [Clostridia bacterium]